MTVRLSILYLGILFDKEVVKLQMASLFGMNKKYTNHYVFSFERVEVSTFITMNFSLCAHTVKERFQICIRKY